MQQKTKATSNRIPQIDALRGFALLGILMVNIFIFHAPYAYYGEFYNQFTGWNTFAFQNMIFFFVGKFMFIFAFLFGYGCWMQYEKYDSAIAFRKFWIRRMSLLAFIGVVHVLLLSFGDILLPYALLGMTLPFLMPLKNRSLFLLFLLVYLVPFYEFMLRPHLDFSIFFASEIPLEEYLRINSSGSFWEIFQLRMQDYASLKNEKLVMYIPKEWSLFVLGIIGARLKWANQLDWKKAGLFCLLAFSLTLLYYLFRPNIFSFFDIEQNTFQRLVVGLGITLMEFIHGMLYIIGFWWLWQIDFFQKILTVLTYVGKLSLTNYLMQSLICAFLFCGYGLGWYGSLTPIQLLLLALLIYIFQIVFSYLWLQKYKFGPIEWLWRKFSYQRS